MLKRGFQFAPGYRLLEFLGRGQFGQVWRASAPGGAACAVKFIDLTDGQSKKEYEGIKRVKLIRHANLMQITAIWLLDADGKVIDEPPDQATDTVDLSSPAAVDQTGMIIMPEVEPAWLVVGMLLGGQSLQARLKECVKESMTGIPPKELIAYMDESAKGLDFLNSSRHDLGNGLVAIQHCDVKPANIVLLGTSAVVCDFGLARILTRAQATVTSASGTPAYMAPEAIKGSPSRHSDQYSLAVTYYHLRTGRLPVVDGSIWEVLEAHRRGDLKLGAVSAAERAVLKKATSLDWHERYESNAEMVDALREALRIEGLTGAASVIGSEPLVHDQSRLTNPPANTDGSLKADANDDAIATIDTAFAPVSSRPTGSIEQGGLDTQPNFLAEASTANRASWFRQQLQLQL